MIRQRNVRTTAAALVVVAVAVNALAGSFLLLLSLLPGTTITCTAFVISSSSSFSQLQQRTTHSQHDHHLTILYKVRRGNLGSLVQDGGDVSLPKAKKNKAAAAAVAAPRRRRNSSKKAKGGSSSSSSSNISPDLAKWMESQQQQQDNDNDDAVQVDTQDDDDDDDVTFASFDKQTTTTTSSSSKFTSSSSPRRTRQAERIAAEQARSAQFQQVIDQLEQVLAEEKNDIQAILAPIRSLLELRNVNTDINLRALTASKGGGGGSNNNNKQRLDYRLAWVGSDDAICHVGTGLHKVPLARLQEVFLSFPGRNVCQMQEVIRIMGPFPNVKNILQGTSSFPKRRIVVTTGSTDDDDDDDDDDDNSKNAMEATDWTITWTSMIDGTGKEVLAGTAENERAVHLDVYLAHPSVVIAVVPPSVSAEDSSSSSSSKTNRRQDPLQDNGKHVLVFVREETMDEKLEALRVA